MFGRGISLFKLFGFEVKLDLSWIIIAVLITWSLASGLFPYHYRFLSTKSYWFMGVAGALGLFASIIFHELCHSLVARKFGLNMRGITLFIFGGVAEMEQEPSSPKAEFLMALTGPLSSMALGAFFWGAYILAVQNSWPAQLYGVLGYLKWINWVLAAFNLVPAFPLDGGRVLRSLLWGWKKNIRWATNIASQIGSGFGFFLILWGIFYILIGAFINGLWYFLIGMFLKNASQMSYQRLLMRKAFEGEKVSQFMKLNPVTVSPETSVKDFVEQFLYKYHFQMLPVIKNGQLYGCLSTEEIKQVPKKDWDIRKVGDISAACPLDNVVSPDMDAMKALSMMNRTGKTRLIVVDQGRLAGIITLKDLLRFFAIKMDLEGENF